MSSTAPPRSARLSRREPPADSPAPAGPAAASAARTITYERRRVRRAVPLAVGALGLAALLAADVTVLRDRVERTLRADAATALAAGGHDRVAVRVEGRDAILTGAVAGEADVAAARAAVRSQLGVRHVEARLSVDPPPAPSPAPTAPVRPAPSLLVSLDGGRVLLTGAVADDAARAALLDASSAFPGPVEDRLSVGAQDGAPVDALAALLAAAASSGASRLDLTWRDGRITLEGAVADSVVEAALLDAAAAATGGAESVTNRLTIEPPAAEPPAAEPSPPLAPPVAPPAPAAAAASPAPAGPAAQLAGAVVEFEFARSDLAGSNAADVLGSVIEVLRASPSLTIVITGFTDNWGPPEINQQLSEARAASVKAALVAAGVDPARLSTVGLADREPVAANDTYWGRSRNRRIEFRTSN